MTDLKNTRLLDDVHTPADLKDKSREELKQIADEVRQEVIDAVSVTGGHLGAGLGVVELTVALHHVFETPRDKIIWDVSHQCYPHKVLTGRRERMGTIRQQDGLSGFTSRAESEYDPFGAAHSSTSISAALGFAAARDYKGEDNKVIAVIGDGAMTAGMAYEAINNVGAQKRPMLIILNDNNMSIAPPSGALSEYLTQLRASMPEEESRKSAIADHGMPNFQNYPTMFEDLGLKYVGPVDGHDVNELVSVLSSCKECNDGPVLLHVVTEKGKGYAPAESAADKYHGVSKFNVIDGKQSKGTPKAPNYQNVFAAALIKEAERDDKIVAVTAAMPSGTGLDKFGAAFPDRCYDVGIAEQHAVTFCGGLACEGFRPFAAIYSTFLQRAYDQIVHDIAIQKLPVRFAIDRAGMVGADGVTHQGSYDITYLGCLPNFVLMGPSDEAELFHMVATAVQIDDRPSAIRYPRGEGTGVQLPEIGTPVEIGKGRILREGSRIAILSYGTRLTDSLAAADKLGALGFSTTVADARFAKPIDDELVRRLAVEHEVLITVEEAAVGGFSTMVFQSLAQNGNEEAIARICPLYLPDFFIDHGKPADQVAAAGLSAPHIVERALKALGVSDKERVHAAAAVSAE